MMESMVEVPPDDGGPISVDGLALDSPWNETESASNNQNILYIAVEYVKDNEYKLEQDSALSPQQVYTEFDQHVSPLDPNMSSVARYSPVYTSDSAPGYDNPVVVVTDEVQSSSDVVPLVDDQTISTHDLQQIVSNQYLQLVNEEQNGGSTSAVDSSVVGNLQMVPDAEQEVDILITDQSTGISYLVERCLADDSQLLDPDSLLDTDLLALDDSTLKSQLSDMKMDIKFNGICKSETVDLDEDVKGSERRSQRLSSSSTVLPESEEQLLSCVQQICDRPILSRARASLPETHLTITKLEIEGNLSSSVFAKKLIPKRTQFGPIEGILRPPNYSLKMQRDQVFLSMEMEGHFQALDVSDESASNWMCFVRLARNYDEQNLILTQQDGGLYYTTIKAVLPKQELLVGYSMSYAQKRDLPVLEPRANEDDLWPCYECPEKFLTSELLQKHLDEHDAMNNQQGNSKKKKKRAGSVQQGMKATYLQCTTCLEVITSQKVSVLQQHLMKHGLDPHEPLQERFILAKCYACDECDAIFTKEEDLSVHVRKEHLDEPVVAPKPPPKKEQSPKREYKCPVCYKIFASGDRIQRHMLVHGSEESKPLQCDKCNKRFLNNSALACHLKTHLLGRKVFECPMCKESFHHVLQLKLHVPKHCVNGNYTCPHCSKQFDKYSIIRKHIRGSHCERKHTCPDCSKPFPTLDKLRMHLLKHSDFREFQCSDCGKQFKRKDKLKAHCKRMHSEERENAMPEKKFTPKVQPTDYLRFIYKCHTCLVGFKRRGMLVNHLAKRHPDISPDSVPELNLPILRATKDYYCNYCDKVYKSSSKRKAHILKNHPGATLPLSNRRLDSSKAADLPNPTFSQTVGSVTTHPQACQWCHKQYASKAKLLQHQRKKHADMMPQRKKHVDSLPPRKKHVDSLPQSKQQSDSKSESEDGILGEEIGEIGEIVEQDGHFFHFVSVDDPTFGQSYLGGDSRVYRLLTTGNNMVPPR